MSNRVLLLAALGAGQTVVDNILVRGGGGLGVAAGACCSLRGSQPPSQRRSESAQESEDIHFMVTALQRLGVVMEVDWPARRITVQGCAGRFPCTGAELFLGNAGTAMR